MDEESDYLAEEEEAVYSDLHKEDVKNFLSGDIQKIADNWQSKDSARAKKLKHSQSLDFIEVLRFTN